MQERSHTFYTTYPSAWQAMLEACRVATKTIDCEQYIFEDDEVGRLFAKVFIQKAGEGVRVRVLLDGVGSSAFRGSDTHLALHKAFVLVQFHNPIRFWPVRVVPQFFRTHRKLLIVDEAVAFAGGMGIAARMKHWRDTQVKVVGAPAAAISRSFQKMWTISRTHRYKRFEKPDETAFYTVYTNAPRFLGRYIYRVILQRIKTAKERIYISTPYFIPSMRLLRALKRARRRGVWVCMFLPLHSDVAIADTAAGSYFEKLLSQGITLYRYTDSVFHTKALVVDQWAVVGSANMDNLSLVFNYELNVGSSEPQFVSQLTQDFRMDLTHAQQVQLGVWRQRPVLQKLKERIVSLIHTIL